MAAVSARSRPRSLEIFGRARGLGVEAQPPASGPTRTSDLQACLGLFRAFPGGPLAHSFPRPAGCFPGRQTRRPRAPSPPCPGQQTHRWGRSSAASASCSSGRARRRRREQLAGRAGGGAGGGRRRGRGRAQAGPGFPARREGAGSGRSRGGGRGGGVGGTRPLFAGPAPRPAALSSAGPACGGGGGWGERGAPTLPGSPQVAGHPKG